VAARGRLPVDGFHFLAVSYFPSNRQPDAENVAFAISGLILSDSPTAKSNKKRYSHSIDSNGLRKATLTLGKEYLLFQVTMAQLEEEKLYKAKEDKFVSLRQEVGKYLF
jgi:hypothetical protein